MEIDVTLDISDINGFSKYLKKRLRKKYLFRRILFSIYYSLFGIVVSGWVGIETKSLTLAIVAFFALIGLYLFLENLRQREVIRSRYKQLSSKNEPPVYTIGLFQDSLYTKTPKVEQKVQWSAVEDIVDDPNHLFLMLSETTGIILPKRSFPTHAHAEDFFNLARAYREGRAAPPITSDSAWPPAPAQNPSIQAGN